MLASTHGGKAHKGLIVLLAVILLLPGIAFAQGQQIAEIKVVGNQRVSTEAILAAIALKPGTQFSEQIVQEAKQAIESMGYFQPGVTVGTESVDTGVRVIFNVAENPVVTEIKITGNTVIKTEKLLSLMRTSLGTVLNNNTLEKDLDALEAYYSELRYFASVTEEWGINPQTGVLTIPILEAKVETIKITGNKKTKDYVVLREMELKPGDVYNELVLTRDLQRIYDLGIFELEGTIANPEPGTTLGNVIVVIPVQEKKTGQLSIALGYDQRRGLLGQAKLAEGNFRGRAETVDLLWEQTGSHGSSYEAGFFEPWLDSKHTSLGVNIYNKLLFRFTSSFLDRTGAGDTDYDERRKGGSLTFSRPLGRTNRGFVTLRSESVGTTLEDTYLPGTDLSPLIADGTVASGTLRFTNDTRDSSLDPFYGAYRSYAVEIGNADFKIQKENPETTLFSKYSIDLRRYFSKGGPRKEINEKRPRLAMRVMAGSLTGDLPFFEQYFVGGAETLRGFKEDRFWGKNMLLASAEYRLPLAQSLTGVLFVDCGDAWGAPESFRLKPIPEMDADGNVVFDPITNEVVYMTDAQGNIIKGDLIDDFSQHEKLKPNIGYGIGIRVTTPIGPLRLDYGFSKEGSRAHFSIAHAF
ncbi:MAG TPA: FtsQ-type POTRA domain-containing protein [Armatimonadota bacterium]|nr:FtsQ-type POTRA domain-containing protein [Armatimonadota bacterium]